ncbi:transposase [Terasakiella brassicae]|uniref:Transposase n=1 Tax=Terasakiella brassicae TaxID=1634917 RepID=A0A917BZD8_9PROT|nr:transposase [Terasakiella brassicae]
MGKLKRPTPEQIITKLREAEVIIAQGNTIAIAARRIGVTEQTYYRWRNQYGGMKTSQAKKMKALEQENARLKKAVAELTLDKLILKEAAEGNY